MHMNNNELSDTLAKAINNSKIFDIHTHLFPSSFKSYALFGLVNLLNNPTSLQTKSIVKPTSYDPFKIT